MTLLNSTQRGNSFGSPVKHIQNRAAYTMKELRVLHWCSLINKMQTEINCRTLMLGTILKSLKIINILITRIMFAKEKILSKLCWGWLLDELRAKRKKNLLNLLKPFNLLSSIYDIEYFQLSMTKTDCWWGFSNDSKTYQPCIYSKRKICNEKAEKSHATQQKSNTEIKFEEDVETAYHNVFTYLEKGGPKIETWTISRAWSANKAVRLQSTE